MSTNWTELLKIGGQDRDLPADISEDFGPKGLVLGIALSFCGDFGLPCFIHLPGVLALVNPVEEG